MQRGSPPSAFSFKVVLADRKEASGALFQEVSGIAPEPGLSDDENKFVHKLPTTPKHPQVQLKRGLAAVNSPFIDWCRSVLEGGLGSPAKTSGVTIYLIDESGTTVTGWSFTEAYPVAWKVDYSRSPQEELVIEEILLGYDVMSLVKG